MNAARNRDSRGVSQKSTAMYVHEHSEKNALTKKSWRKRDPVIGEEERLRRPANSDRGKNYTRAVKPNKCGESEEKCSAEAGPKFRRNPEQAEIYQSNGDDRHGRLLRLEKKPKALERVASSPI